MKLNSRRQKAKATLTEKVPNEETPIDRKEDTPLDLVNFAGIIKKKHYLNYIILMFSLLRQNSEVSFCLMTM